MTNKQLGDILIAAGDITQAQLDECLQVVGASGESLDTCLLEKEYITPAQLAAAYAKLTSLPLVEKITEKMADPTLLAKAPLKFLRDNKVMPIIVEDATVIVTPNPLNFQPLDELNVILDGTATYAVAAAPLIVDAINRYYPIEGAKQMIEELEEEEVPGEDVDFEDIDERDILSVAGEAPIIRLVNHILVQAVKRGASDIHIEPFEKELRVRYRIDGVMHDAMTPPKRVQSALISRIKIMANLDIAEKRVPQDGRIQIKVADKAIDIRVSVLPVHFGERIVMRLLDVSRTFAALETLGFDKRDYDIVVKSIERPNGIIYVTGPTGSGKTTTLYSILASLNKPDTNIITVEDPVEYQMPGINQVQVREKVGLSFAAALRSILRQDPDIIMIGETRDFETAQISIQAALTGHLVLSTLHTNDAPSSITRLIDMGVELFLIASTVNMIIAQRLVRKLCDKCKEAFKPDAELLKRFGLTPEAVKNITFYRAKGCDECMESGYRGRLAIFEVMEMSENVAKATMERANASVIRKYAIEDGMTTLMQDGLRRAEEGLTTLEEVLTVATMD